MIDVDFLYNLIADRIRKDHQGAYMDNDEYNRLLPLMQETLFNYFYSNKDETWARHSLIAFESNVVITPTIGGYRKPTDYKNKIDALYLASTGSVPIHFPARDEWAMSKTSPIRGGSLERGTVIGRIGPVFIELDPSGDPLRLRYYSNLPNSERIMTIDVPTQTEVYDLANSTQLDWDESNIVDFVDLALLFKGLEIRDSSLIQWVQAKTQINENIYSKT